MQIFTKIGFLIILLFFGCKNNIPQTNRIYKIIQNKPLLLYLEVNANTASPRVGKLISYDFSKKNVVFAIWYNDSMTKLIPNSNKICSMAEIIYDSYNIYIINPMDNNVKEINLARFFSTDTLTEYISDYQFINDSILYFSKLNCIYKYNINSDSLILIKNTSVKKIVQISLNDQRSKIGFSYTNNTENYFADSSGVYDLLNDKILFLNKKVNYLGNWSPDGSLLICSNFDEIIIYNWIEDSYLFIKNNNINYLECFFKDDRYVIFQGINDFSDLSGTIYLYDLKSNSVVKELINDNYGKTELSFYR